MPSCERGKSELALIGRKAYISSEPDADTNPMETSGLEVHALSKRYGTRFALDQLSFHARPGEVLGVLGPNGAGKSTAFLSLNGLLRPDGGRISLDGKLMGSNRGQSIALIPETPDVVPHAHRLGAHDLCREAQSPRSRLGNPRA